MTQATSTDRALTVDCPECEGEGRRTYSRPGGRFDSAFGNYLPDDYEARCDDCDGTGQVDAPEPDEQTDEDNA